MKFKHKAMPKYFENPFNINKISKKSPNKEIRYNHYIASNKINKKHKYSSLEKYDDDYINPYKILNITPDASIQDCRNAYFKLATNPSREIRSKACLAYDALCNKEKYENKGNYYKVKKKDIAFIIVL